MGSFNGLIFHGAVAEDAARAIDIAPLLQFASGPTQAPDMFGFAFQPPIIRTAGSSGSAIRIDFTGNDLDKVTAAGAQVFFALMGQYGPGAARPTPGNFLAATPQIQIVPDDVRLQEAGLDRSALGLALQAAGDGIRLVKAFEDQAVLRDVIIISEQSGAHKIDGSATNQDPQSALRWLQQLPVATPQGGITDLGSLASITYERVPEEIQRVDRERSVTIELTPPEEVPLEMAIAGVESLVANLRAQGMIDPTVGVNQSGSAGALNAIKTVLLGDGSLVGTITSSLFLALLVVYLLMVVLFQSWLQPLVIMISVPLATFGGFVGIGLLHAYSVGDRYTPVVNMDILTILGFVILAGVVVNNAILIVSQSLTWRKQNPQRAIAEVVGIATASRVRPIAMSMLTSIGGMLPLVLFPGSGTELYRGLAAVLVGGLAMSTLFTLVLVPLLLVIVLRWVAAPSEDDSGVHTGAQRVLPSAMVFLASSLLLGGCAVGPDYRGAPATPADSVSFTLPDTSTVQANTWSPENAAAQDRWWQQFNDPILNELMQRGIAENNNLEAALARLAAAESTFRIVSGQQWPDVNGVAAAQRGRTSEAVAGGGGQTSNRFDVGVALSWEIDLWGRLRRQTAAARAATEISRAELDAVYISVRASIAATYIRYRELQARLASAEANRDLLWESVELTRSRVRAGLAPELDVAQAEGVAYEVEAAIPALRRLRDETLGGLAVILGATETTVSELLQTVAPLPTPPTQLTIAVPAELLRRRPDVRSAERNLLFRTERIGVATADLYPRLSLTGAFGWASSSTGDLFTNPASFWTIRPDIDVALFNRDKLYAQVEVREYELQEAIAQYQQTVVAAIQETQDAIRAFSYEEERREKLMNAQVAQRQAVVFAQAAYRQGLSQYQPVLDAQRQLVLVEDRLWEATAARATAVVDVYRALGGSWNQEAVNERRKALDEAVETAFD